MTRYVVLMVVWAAIVLCPPFETVAQDEILFIVMPDDVSNPTYVNNVFYALEDRLQEEGFLPIRYLTADQPISPYLKLSVIISSNPEGYRMTLSTLLWRLPLSDSSPLLQNNNFALNTVLQYGVGDQEATDLVVEFLLALNLYSVGECDRAVARFTVLENQFAAIRLDTRNLFALVHFYKGNCFLLSADYSTAVQEYESALQIPAERTLYLDGSVINLAWVYIQVGRPDDAFALLTTEINRFDVRFSPEWVAAAYEMRGQFHGLAQQFPEAISDLTRSIELGTNPQRYTVRGSMYRALYEWDSALNDFNAALEMNSAYPDAYYERGLLYVSILQTGDDFYDEALADFQQYLVLAPSGDHAAEATRYISDLQSQRDALNS